MAKFVVIIEVDEEILKQARLETNSEEDLKDEPTTESIEQEMGWVNASGISVLSVEKYEQKS